MEELWNEISSKYTNDLVFIGETWKSIENHYSEKHRAYHTLDHLHNILEHSQEYFDKIINKDAFYFSLFFHDLIYNPKSNSNEEDSADLAIEYLQKIDFPQQKIKWVEKCILATKKHRVTNDSDINLFLDLDLIILSSEMEEYDIYAKDIRFEYSFVAIEDYKLGRKKVLESFINKESIYIHPSIESKFGARARTNIQRELKML
jgi:predicted metal-dependent HD superfamily phosphohydrolase